MSGRQQANPLFSVSCLYNRVINFIPDSEEWRGWIIETIMKGFTVICNNELLIDCDEFNKYTQMLEDSDDKQFEDEIDLLNMVIHDDNWQEYE